ncbi:hypothetical protein BDV34DRAFT_230236 [Aspergillus parasiticus]|uniref:Uncharacterized protein n=1 Tax=Aspergillus parasiticus TaxID=5067 RepID=A0A5N6D5H7_ASPPA|nr:hypothetical protein BDV34DRAFT_230236 [Aspergillus parasiticus]
MKGEGLPARFKERIDELEQMLQLTHQLATIHTCIQVRDRKAEGALPRDDSEFFRWKRSQYRARFLDIYFEGGVYPWMFKDNGSSVDKNINVERSKFH